jgi:hypothetical protein
MIGGVLYLTSHRSIQDDFIEQERSVKVLKDNIHSVTRGGMVVEEND